MFKQINIQDQVYYLMWINIYILNYDNLWFIKIEYLRIILFVI